MKLRGKPRRNRDFRKFTMPGKAATICADSPRDRPLGLLMPQAQGQLCPEHCSSSRAPHPSDGDKEFTSLMFVLLGSSLVLFPFFLFPRAHYSLLK